MPAPAVELMTASPQKEWFDGSCITEPKAVDSEMFKTTIIIEPARSWVIPDFAELWDYRELLYLLAWRDISVRYKQTLLGAAWAILQPLFAMVVFTVLFGKIAKVPSDGVPYSIFAYAGLLPWTFFSNSVTNSGNSLVGSASLITKVYFPRMIIPAAAVTAGLADFAVASAIFFVMMVLYGLKLTMSILMLVPLVALISTTALAAGFWLSALNVKYRDVRYAVPFFVQMGMYVTPIVYPLSVIPTKWRCLFALNPLSGIIEGFRSALLGRPFNWPTLILSSVLTLGLLFYSGLCFGKMEREFADIV
jgi:lipopolysaccharide transport system permease protein